MAPEVGTDAPHLLLVEDDVDVLDTLSELLDERGYRTVRARDGAQAMRLLHEMVASGSRLPDLILLDLMMPNMDGWQFRAQQRQHPALRDIPAVVLTADTDPQTRAASLGAAACLRKPVGLDDLLEVIKRCAASGG